MRLLNQFRSRLTERLLQGTTFSEERSEVCTPRCRQESALNRARQAVYRVGPPSIGT